MEYSEAYPLLIRIFSEEVSEQEKAKIEKWLSLSPENRQLYEDVRQIMLNAEAPKPPLPDVEMEWQVLAEKLSFALEKKAANVHRMPSNFWNSQKKYFAAAAAVILLLCSVYFLQQSPSLPVQFVEVNSDEIASKSITLEDGSIVHLNHDTRFKHPVNFTGSERRVFLDGEAFFEIQSEKARSFIVETPHSQTTVLGTKFNVWARAGKTKVVVQEGKVALQSLSASNVQAVLSAGEMRILDNEGRISSSQNIRVENFPFWLYGNISFYQSPLPEIAKELERIYQRPVKLAVESPDTYSLTGIFEKSSIESTISTICITLNLEYRVEADYILVFQK